MNATADCFNRGLFIADCGQFGRLGNEGSGIARRCGSRLLLQMATHRFAREMLAFQRLHFVTVGIGSFDLSQIQRLLSKALALADFSPVGTLRRRSIFRFSGLGGVCGWHTLALFLQNSELMVADSSCVQRLALHILCRLCGFFGNNRLGVFFRRLLLSICCRFRLLRRLLSLGFSFLQCRAYQPLALILHSQRSPRLAALRSWIRRLYWSGVHFIGIMPMGVGKNSSGSRNSFS